ncbi:putative peptidyl-prolyl cis-trans isomerase [Rubripirellula amarantea]|uniref:peptidylprolyl isomerase n=1 Tax=Rubripirellula amarantea TaxID=2527999 RepID=A0A5C5WGG0_9BACT|nr:peptidylprolyl isomerase [Rubripirellula amarantea]TWT49103.1 putative peptidyl-prolyl cis-trans isomerase [Rubripirellula amarantea]
MSLRISSLPTLPSGCAVAIFALLGLFSTQASAQEAPSTSSDSGAESTELALPDLGPPITGEIGSGAGPMQADASTEAEQDFTNDPEYLAEVERLTKAFEDARHKLETAVVQQRLIYTRYLNAEARSKADRESYTVKRDEVRSLMDETYTAALDLSRITGNEEAAQYILTMIQHRFERGIYNLSTAEGAARLIDGGARYLLLFKAGARSALVSGKFDIAKRLYEAIDRKDMEKVDIGMFISLEELEKSWEKESEIREQEAQADDLPRVKFVTTQGEFTVELFINEAPSTVANFINLVEQGFYDGLDFHQVVDNMLALTGDPSGLGSGGSGKFLVDEFDPEVTRTALRGYLVMAKLPVPGSTSGEFVPNSASSQFAILYMPIVANLGEQTVFGCVIEGMDVVSRLRRVDPSKKAEEKKMQLPPDRILETTVLRRPDTLPEVKYFDVRAALQAEQDRIRAAQKAAESTHQHDGHDHDGHDHDDHDHEGHDHED